MEHLLITQGACAVAPFAGPRPEATHEVRWFFRHDHHHDHDELLGRILVNWSEPREQRRIESLSLRIQFTLQCSWNQLRRDIVPLVSLDKARRTLSDHQRFVRKMDRVLRAYDEQRDTILRGGQGLPEIGLQLLDQELDQAWQKAQRIYGFSRTDHPAHQIITP